MSKKVPPKFVTVLVVGLLAFSSCGGGEEHELSSSAQAVDAAMLSNTFGPWSEALSVFGAETIGESKWEALMFRYASAFTEGEVSLKRRVAVSLEGTETFLTYCSDEKQEGDCEGSLYRLVLTEEDGSISDISWSQGKVDEELEEMSFYEIEASILPDQWPIEISIEKGYEIGESSCLGINISPRYWFSDEYERWKLDFWYDAVVKTSDGIQKKSNTRGNLYPEGGADDSMDVIYCVDYPMSLLSELVFDDGGIIAESRRGILYDLVLKSTLKIRLQTTRL